MKQLLAFIVAACAVAVCITISATSRCAGEAPSPVLTPQAPPTPRINGPQVLGVRPGHPVLFTISATGDRPIAFLADGLPDGLKLDAASGRITGAVQEKGEYALTLHANSAAGSAERKFRLVVGPQIALTPPMGWNSWNCFASAVDDAKVRAAADAMVASGLINHGWSYINIDDCWEVAVKSGDPMVAGEARDKDGMINSNKKFPDMKALCNYVHEKGLKIGLYSSPGPATCGGFTASYQHEEQDARRYAEWGFDYLKYDWCSYAKIANYDWTDMNKRKKPDIAALQKPYRQMGTILENLDRDIVYSLCQYGMGNVWEWGSQVGGNCWRTTGDITDTWTSVVYCGFSQAGHELYAGPGHWNDPDMLVVGRVGWGKLHPSRLTPNEQYTHISLWCLLSAPLLIGCDMTKMDALTLGLLTNDEVLAVDQDPLGRQASRVLKSGDLEVWAKDMQDGSKAVGLFNRGSESAEVTATWADLKIEGRRTVRDLWRQKDLGEFEGAFQATVASHGVVLVRISK